MTDLETTINFSLDKPYQSHAFGFTEMSLLLYRQLTLELPQNNVSEPWAKLKHLLADTADNFWNLCTVQNKIPKVRE